jgi:hypothetical protein
MNPHYSAFIDLGKALAAERALQWEIPLNTDGTAADGVGWNLTTAANAISPPNHYLRDFSPDSKASVFLKDTSPELNDGNFHRGVLSPAWQDLMKAAAAEQLFFRRNSVLHVVGQVLRPMRVLATCTVSEPWQLNADDIRSAIRGSAAIQPSGKLRDLVIGIVKTLFDAQHLTDSGPLYAVLGDRQQYVNAQARAKYTLSKEALRDGLRDRKREERLPERRAFWELIRIVMTQDPRTFVDEIRFAAIRTMIVTGFRIGEAALLPLDWKRQRNYFDAEGKPAGLSGGISTSVMIRHFAEKQQSDESDSNILVEGAQPIPELFLDIVNRTLDRAASLTGPLRKTHKLQCETGRLLPWYKADELVTIPDLYIHLTGNPLWTSQSSGNLTEQYRKTFDPTLLQELYESQWKHYRRGNARLAASMYVFLNRLQVLMRSDEIPLRFRNASGRAIAPTNRMEWGSAYIRASELETYIATGTPSKVSDMQPIPMASGSIQPWEFMFIHPKRSLMEERNGGICDVTRYIAVGRPDSSFIGLSIGAQKLGETIFAKYGETDADRALTLESHSLRHLQNTELFRLGVADTIISKRFNRRSVVQTYEYDHRSLAEDLEQIELSPEVEIRLGTKAATVAKMIKTGRANGPIVDTFKKIQSTDGDEAAYEYLRVEADGFHATPYGHCLNSFTVDPCPKHLECFSGCRHLSATNLPENREHLIRLESRLQDALDTIRSRTSSSLGWKNQLAHAEQRLAGVRKILAADKGEHPFPNGPDLSMPPRPGILDD